MSEQRNGVVSILEKYNKEEIYGVAGDGGSELDISQAGDRFILKAKE